MFWVMMNKNIFLDDQCVASWDCQKHNDHRERWRPAIHINQNNRGIMTSSSICHGPSPNPCLQHIGDWWLSCNLFNSIPAIPPTSPCLMKSGSSTSLCTGRPDYCTRYPTLIEHSYWKWLLRVYKSKWWFSTVMLVYKRVVLREGVALWITIPREIAEWNDQNYPTL